MPSGEMILKTLLDLLSEQHKIKVEYRITKEEGEFNEKKKIKSKSA